MRLVEGGDPSGPGEQLWQGGTPRRPSCGYLVWPVATLRTFVVRVRCKWAIRTLIQCGGMAAFEPFNVLERASEMSEGPTLNLMSLTPFNCLP